MKVGDTVVMGVDGTLDSHVISALTPTTVTWVRALQRATHGIGEAVWVQNTAGGGFAPSASDDVKLRAGRAGWARRAPTGRQP
jgi:hypothetical protein